MPPEVLIIPPNYSSQMDCFSLGVLIVQIITRNFPDPGDAHKVSEDASHPTGSVVVQIPELERRKRDIDVIESDHPLLPVAICCLHDRSMDRPPASELCEKLAKLKTQEKYASSVESYGDQTRVIQKMKEELEAKEKTISETKAELQKRDKEHEEEKKVLNEQLTKTKQALEKCQLSFQQSKDAERKEFQAEMQVRAEKHEIEKEKMKKEIEAMKQQIEEQHSQSKRNEAVARKYLMEMEAKDEEADNTSLPSQLTTKPTQMLEIDKTSLQQDNPLTETGETNSMSLQQPLVTNNTPLQDVKQGETDDVPPQQVNKPMETSEAVDTDCAALQQDNKTPDSDGAAQQGETDNISQQSDQLVETTENMSPQQDDKPVETPQTDGSTSLTEEPESVETPRTDLSAATKEPVSYCMHQNQPMLQQ